MFGLVAVCNFSSKQDCTFAEGVRIQMAFCKEVQVKCLKASKPTDVNASRQKPGSVSSLATTNPPALNDSAAHQLVVVIYLGPSL